MAFCEFVSHNQDYEPLEDNIDKIKSLRAPFNADDFIECTIRKLKQKKEEVKMKQKQLKAVYNKLKLNVSIQQILNATNCTYYSRINDYKKLSEDEVENLDENEITLRWKLNVQFAEDQSKHTINVMIFDTQFLEAFETTANEFNEMDEDEKDEFLENLEETEVEIYVQNSYESREWKTKTYISLKTTIEKKKT
eukprot:35524_1